MSVYCYIIYITRCGISLITQPHAHLRNLYSSETSFSLELNIPESWKIRNIFILIFIALFIFQK